MRLLDRVKDFFIKPRTKTLPVVRERKESPIPFTAEYVQQMLMAGASGLLGDLYKFYVKMTTIDPFLGGLDLHLTSAVTQVPVIIDFKGLRKRGNPNEVVGNSYIMAYQRILDMVWDAFPLRKAVQLLTYAHKHGVSILEPIWGMYERNGKLWWGITDIRHYPFNSIRTDSDGEIIIVFEDGTYKKWYEIHPSKMVFVEAEDGRHRYHQIGAMRKVIPWFVAKEQARKWWLDFTEVYGFPYRVARVPDTASLELINSVESALQSIGAHGYAILPEDADFELVEPNKQGTVTVYRDLIDYAHKHYAISMIGTADIVGDNREGSYARLKISNSIRYEFVRNISALIEEGLTQMAHLIIMANFGDGLNPIYLPKVKMRVLPPTDQLELANTLKVLSEIQPNSLFDDSYVRELFNIPEPSNQEG